MISSFSLIWDFQLYSQLIKLIKWSDLNVNKQVLVSIQSVVLVAHLVGVKSIINYT